MTASSINWKQGRGVLPYFFHQDPFKDEFIEPEFKILNTNETLEVKQYLKLQRNIVEKLEMCHSVWQFHLMDKLPTTHLISDLNGKQELSKITTPLTVYLSYPFTKVVSVKLYPISRKWKNGKVERLFTVGYLFWQIARVYAQIYQAHWGEAGVYDFGLSDLHFEDCYIDDQGKVSLFIGS
ncbi:MAG: hypothetical protein AAFO94_17020 [Bacteroidota bacterium]